VDAGARPYVLRRAAEQVATEGDREAAISYHGRAINAYLEAGEFAQAAAECRRLLRFAPDVVRAHCTLAVLAIGNGQYGDAVDALEHYVEATLKTGTQSYSIPRLRLMAQLADHAALRDTIADGLARLGDAEEADRVRALPPPPEGGDPARASQRWDQLLRIALTDARELWWLTWTRTNETMPFGTAETTGPALRDSLWW
jgi:tetratricopeptide (TPR) repeat protein